MNSSFQPLLKISNALGSPLPLDSPHIKFTDRDKRQCDSFSFDVRSIQICTRVTVLNQIGKHIGVEKNGIHAEALTPILIGGGDKVVDVLIWWPSPSQLSRI